MLANQMFPNEIYPWAILIGILLIVFIIAKLLLVEKERMPYELRPSLVTKSELAFFHQLVVAVGDDWQIVSMVRIADLIRVKKGTPTFQAWQNKIHAKHIDFVLCDPETLAIGLAIELDDASHQRKDRIERDLFVNTAFADCGLPLLRVPVAKEYDIKALRVSIEELVDGEV
jgi:very-short-patch-repair endonuclease